MLYEMIMGTRPFRGDDVTDTIAAVVRADPDRSNLHADTPAAIHRLLRRCLEKDRIRRLLDAADARLEIGEALTSPADGAVGVANPEPVIPNPVRSWRHPLPVALTAAALAAAAVLMLWAPWRAAAPPHVTRTTITISGPAALMINGVESGSLAKASGRIFNATPRFSFVSRAR